MMQLDDLILNPKLKIEPVCRGDAIIGFSLAAPVKGRGLIRSMIEISNSTTELFSVLRNILVDKEDIEISEICCKELVALGALIQRDQLSHPVRFFCHLDDEVSHAEASASAEQGRELVSRAEFSQREQLEHVLAPGNHLVLVRDSSTGVRLPYWLDSATEVESTHGVGRGPGSQHSEVSAQRTDETASRRWTHVHSSEFLVQGYTVLRGLLPRNQLLALQRYYRQLIAEGYVEDHDRQVPLRSAQHNEPLMRYFHKEFWSFFSGIADTSLRPSYAYLSSYRRGASLAEHTDREQCEITASLLIDYEATAMDTSTWPLYLRIPGESRDVAVELNPGDAVLFRGRELPHYRLKLEAVQSTSFFLHYVDSSYSGSLH
jgi:alkylated DNA repair dioxygenase AlkB